MVGPGFCLLLHAHLIGRRRSLASAEVVSWLPLQGELHSLSIYNNFHLLFFLTLILGCL